MHFFKFVVKNTNKKLKQIFILSLSILTIQSILLGYSGIIGTALDTSDNASNTAEQQAEKTPIDLVAEERSVGKTEESESVGNANVDNQKKEELFAPTIIEKKLEQEVENIKVTFESGTEVSIDQEVKDTSTITKEREDDIKSKKEIINDAEATKNLLVKNIESKSEGLNFELGFEDEHLIFSKPVKVEIEVANVDDGSTAVVKVKHLGENEFGTDALVNQDGTPQNLFEVKDGKIIFWTLGASIYNVTTTTGTLAFTSPANGGTLT
jgi:hypothetical protein